MEQPAEVSVTAESALALLVAVSPEEMTMSVSANLVAAGVDVDAYAMIVDAIEAPVVTRVATSTLAASEAPGESESDEDGGAGLAILVAVCSVFCVFLLGGGLFYMYRFRKRKSSGATPVAPADGVIICSKAPEVVVENNVTQFEPASGEEDMTGAEEGPARPPNMPGFVQASAPCR